MKTKLTSFFLIIIGILIGIILTLTIHRPNKELQIAPQETTSQKIDKLKASNTNTIKLSQKRAIAIFQKLYSRSKIYAINLTKEHGIYYYEIDGFDQAKECNIKIDAQNGKIISQQTINSEYSDEDFEALNFNQLIDRKTASQIALHKAGGGEIQSWLLERNSNDNFPVWIIQIVDGQDKYSVKINAENKEVIE